MDLAGQMTGLRVRATQRRDRRTALDGRCVRGLVNATVEKWEVSEQVASPGRKQRRFSMLSLNRSLHVSLLITALTVGAVALIGCGPDKHEAIPQSASLVTQGNGDLTFTAPHEGMAYVYDPGDHK